MKTVHRLSFLLLALGWCRPALAADEYWTYQYKQISVTAEGNADFARTLAHNLYRLDLSIAEVLQTKPSWRPNIVLYAVPADLFTAFSGLSAGNGSVGRINPYKSTLLLNTSLSGESSYWSLYYSFGSSVLGTTYSFRYPPWFLSGLAEVFAASTVDRNQVIIGGANRGLANGFRTGVWIPLQTLLSVRANDPQMSSSAFQAMYSAEIWYLVHKIVIDQFYHANFYQYFLSLDRGEDETKAFTDSFDITYEELDKALKKSVTANKFMQIRVTIADEDDAVKPVLLSEAEAKGRLAIYAAEQGVQPERALELSAAALKLDPNNEDAKVARVRAELRGANRDAASRDADEICGREPLSSKVAATCAFVFGSLARRESDKSSQAELRTKALRFYEQTVQLEPEDLPSWYGMSSLVSDIHDTAYVKAFLPKFAAVQAAHADIGSLAGSLAGLYSAMGDEDTAMKYALLWQSHSMSTNDRANATAYISRLKNASDRKQAEGGTSPPTAQP